MIVSKPRPLPALVAAPERTVAIMRSITLEQAVEQGRPLCDALEEAKVATVDALHLMLKEVATFHGASEFKEAARTEVIRALSDRYGHLSIEEIALVFGRARTPDGSRESKVYGQLTPAVVLGWVGAYANSDERVKYWERENNASTEYVEGRDEAGKVTRHRMGNASQNEPTDMLGLLAACGRVVSGGRIALRQPNPEAVATLLTVPPKPGSAAWFRAEADRLEAKEAAEVARKEYAKRAVAGMIDAERLEEQAKTGFKKYAHDNYYSLLNEQERAVLAAAENGMLAADEMEVYEYLTLAWQGTLMGWEDEQVKHIVELGKTVTQKSHD